MAAESPPTVAEVRKAFDRQKEIEYSISSISGKDLEITKENDRLVIRFAYDKEIPIVEPVFLLMKYKGQLEVGLKTPSMTDPALEALQQRLGMLFSHSRRC